MVQWLEILTFTFNDLVRSLVGEQRSHKLGDMAKKLNKDPIKKNWIIRHHPSLFGIMVATLCFEFSKEASIAKIL